ncbi:ABC transporter permease [Cereibacter sphaeroides]|uniref:ABC transporter permease n=1 Tax=Cereibacter sphaeroides TaxID=1063 RepID=UPI001F39905E|nr:ABC transporter permease [Cereibacter sphaeroides]MCE6959382.1 ABC transporter permease [Cereibacter sphaeroides]MCE6973847.1 ABC transporter permease [Cereibacter sphaeroides]
MKALGPALAMLALWQAVVMLTGVPAFILPAPLAVLRELVSSRTLLLSSAATTLAEIGAGLVAGCLAGLLAGLATALSVRIARLLRPVLVISQAVPVFALAPILTLWLGYGMESKVAVVVLIVFFPVASALHDGLRATPQATLDLARLARASRLRTLVWLRLPHALPHLGAALRIAAVYAPIGAVIGEWVGASQGLGHLMLLANARMKTDLMFAALAVLAVLTLALRAAVDALLRRFGL